MRASLLTAAFFAGSIKARWIRELPHPQVIHLAGAVPSNNASRSMVVGPAARVSQGVECRRAQLPLRPTAVSRKGGRKERAVEWIAMLRHRVRFILLAPLQIAVWVAAASCGGALQPSEDSIDGASDASELADQGNDATGQIEENPVDRTPCPMDSACAADALTGAEGPGTVAGQDAASVSNAAICGYYSGPLEAGVDAGGPAIQCNPGWECLPLNGRWACCTVPGVGGLSSCIQPFISDGG